MNSDILMISKKKKNPPGSHILEGAPLMPLSKDLPRTTILSHSNCEQMFVN